VRGLDANEGRGAYVSVVPKSSTTQRQVPIKEAQMGRLQ